MRLRSGWPHLKERICLGLGTMGLFKILLQCGLHALQLGGAIAACVFYASTYDGVTKDYRWNFAITTSAFSIAGTIIQSGFYGIFYTDDGGIWAALSAQCSGILFFFWIGVLGTFASSFIHLDASDNNGIRMMQIAVYVDAANIIIWFLTGIDMAVMSANAERPPPRRNTGELYSLSGGANLSTPFVPHGWDAADIEAQTLAVHLENPPLPPTTGIQAADLNIHRLVLPELPPPAVTTESGGNATWSWDMEGGIPVSQPLPDELLDFLPMPPLRSAGTPDWLLQDPQSSSAPSRPPRLPSKHRAYTNFSKHPNRHSSYKKMYDLQDRLEAHDTSSGSESPKSSIENVTSPFSSKWNGPTKECLICAEEHPRLTAFPSKISKACSNHEQEACRDCIDKSILAELESNIYGSIHCPLCRAVLDYEEVKAFSSHTTFVQYERMGLRSFIGKNPNFVWCQNSNCSSGQEHVGGVDQPIVTCQACGCKTCFKHQIPWHEEMLCDEYDERVRLSNGEQQSRAQQELASIATIHEATKPCANKACKAPIQKTQGCDHMKCSLCKYEFCWVCGENWKGPHRRGCGFG